MKMSGSRYFRPRNEGGQVTILVALMTTMLLSSMALVVDVGAAYDTRRQLQNSADAAALAGVMEVAEGRGRDSAEAVARQYIIDSLGAKAGPATVTFPADNKVKVEVKTTQDTFFARIFGSDSVQVGARATAESFLAGKVNHLMPMIVPTQRVGNHIGPENTAVFELGADRPMESLSIIYSISGSRVVYTVTYANTSNKAVNVEVWSPVPADSSYVSGSATGGGYLSDTDVRWIWANVAAGDTRVASYAVDFEGAVDPANKVYAGVDGGTTESASTDGAQKGYFWLTDFNTGSAGTPELNEWIIDGYPEAVSTGDLANGVGVRSSLKSAMDTRLVRDSSVVLPVYDYTAGGGRQGEYHVVGFAELVITDFNFSGNPKSVTGYFTSGTVVAGYAGGSPVDHGVKAIRLSE